MPPSPRALFGRVRPIIAIAALSFVIPSSAAGQTDGKLLFMVTPYVYGTGLNGTVGIRDRIASVDASFADIVNHLRMGAMITAEARRDRVSLAGDLIFLSIRADHDLARAPGSLDISFAQRAWIVSLAGGYSAMTWSKASIDILLGARYWSFGADIGATTGGGASAERSGSRAWVDATVGVAGRVIVLDRWRLAALVDGGGGGSQNTAQVVATIGYDFSTRYGLNLGYRYLAVDYDHDNFLNDTRMSGVILAFTFRFPSQR